MRVQSFYMFNGFSRFRKDVILVVTLSLGLDNIRRINNNILDALKIISHFERLVE